MIPWCSFSSENFICQEEGGQVSTERGCQLPSCGREATPLPDTGHQSHTAPHFNFSEAAEDGFAVTALGPRPSSEMWVSNVPVSWMISGTG